MGKLIGIIWNVSIEEKEFSKWCALFFEIGFYGFVFGFEGVFRAEFRADEMCSYLLFHLLSSGIPIQSVQTLKTGLLISGKEIIHQYFREEAVVTTG